MATKKVSGSASTAAKSSKIKSLAPKRAAKTAARAVPKSAAAAAPAAQKAANGGGLVVGKKVPAFSAASTGGKAWKSSEAAGKNVVIYFYPRDNTTGCTKEGEDFRDLAPAFKKANTQILGVSTDSLASHEKFKARYSFPFELLSDEQQQLCRLFDVIKEKSMYGRKFMGVERSTFLIDASGVLRHEWRKVKVPGHAEAVLAAAQAL